MAKLTGKVIAAVKKSKLSEAELVQALEKKREPAPVAVARAPEPEPVSEPVAAPATEEESPRRRYNRRDMAAEA